MLKNLFTGFFLLVAAGLFLCPAGAHASAIQVKEVRASSHLPPSKAGSYGPENVLTENLAEPWVEGADGDGTGQWLEFIFTRQEQLASVRVCTGYQKSQKSFADNGRVKSFSLALTDGTTKSFNLKDAMGCEDFALDGVSAQSAKITIEAVYPGARWQDTGISHVRFFAGAGAPATAPTATAAVGESGFAPGSWKKEIDDLYQGYAGFMLGGLFTGGDGFSERKDSDSVIYTKVLPPEGPWGQRELTLETRYDHITAYTVRAQDKVPLISWDGNEQAYAFRKERAAAYPDVRFEPGSGVMSAALKHRVTLLSLYEQGPMPGLTWGGAVANKGALAQEDSAGLKRYHQPEGSESLPQGSVLLVYKDRLMGVEIPRDYRYTGDDYGRGEKLDVFLLEGSTQILEVALSTDYAKTRKSVKTAETAQAYEQIKGKYAADAPGYKEFKFGMSPQEVMTILDTLYPAGQKKHSTDMRYKLLMLEGMGYEHVSTEAYGNVDVIQVKKQEPGQPNFFAFHQGRLVQVSANLAPGTDDDVFATLKEKYKAKTIIDKKPSPFDGKSYLVTISFAQDGERIIYVDGTVLPVMPPQVLYEIFYVEKAYYDNATAAGQKAKKEAEAADKAARSAVVD